MKLSSSQIAKILRELGDRIEFDGGNAYRARAYRRAADNLQLSAVPLAQLIAEDRLQEIPGVGDALAAVIRDIYENDDHPRLAAMREEMPSSVLEMLRIPGLRQDRIRKLFTEQGISTVAELEAAAREDRLSGLKGFGPAFQAKVLEGIEISRGPPRLHMHKAAAAMTSAVTELRRANPEWTEVTPAGQARRGCELVRELTVVAVDPRHTGADVIMTRGDISIRLTSPARYGIALLWATGSVEHLAALAKIAKQRTLTLDENGLRKGERVLAAGDEEQIYQALGLPWIPPELRETSAETDRVLEHGLPELVITNDLKGVLHAHTNESDGSDTLEEMAEAARTRGYQYLGLTDHSQTAHYAGGLKVAEVVAQQAAVDQLNYNYGDTFHVFKGIESDILADGSLDYPSEVLATFDLVIASVHSKFKLSREEQTERIVRAIENPHTTVLGHVTGRQLLRRAGYEVDMERILKACAAHDVAVEINAHPWRLDLDWRWCAKAVELGCMFSINPDAHTTGEIDNVRWGITMARKGGVPRERVINALSMGEFASWLRARGHPGRNDAKGLSR